MDKVTESNYLYETGGISVLFINDYDNVFCPVLDLDVPGLVLTQEVVDEKQIFTKFSVAKLKIFYYNPKLGDWEPFLENLNFDYDSFQVVGN